jgi:hypothetical protein
MRLTTFKRTVMAIAVAVGAAVVVVGMPSKADALVVAPGDAVLVIYGNDQQGYLNLGSWNTLKANGGSFPVSGILNTPGVSGMNTIEYTVVGNFGTGTLTPSAPMFFGTDTEISNWSVPNKNGVLPVTYNTNLTNWGGPLTQANDPTRTIYSKTDPTLSFSKYLDPLENDTLGGSIPRRGSADINNVLYLLERTGAASTLAGITTAMLSSQTGLFTVGTVPIPVPAAAVLFATGLIGLVGVARRAKGLAI